MDEKKKVIKQILEKWYLKKTEEAISLFDKEEIGKYIEVVIEKDNKDLAIKLREYSKEKIIEILNTVQWIENGIDKEVQEFKEIAQKECTAKNGAAYRCYNLVKVLLRISVENKSKFITDSILRDGEWKKKDGSFKGFEKERVREYISQIMVREGAVDSVGEISDEMLVNIMEDVETITKKIEEEVEKNRVEDKMKENLVDLYVKKHHSEFECNLILKSFIVEWIEIEPFEKKDSLDLLMILWDIGKKEDAIDLYFFESLLKEEFEKNYIKISEDTADVDLLIESMWRIWKEGKNKK